MSQRGLFIGVTRPSSPEREGDYNRWYDEVHLPDVVQIPGVKSARRFKGLDISIPDEVAGQYLGIDYLAIYEIESEDVAETMENIFTAILGGELRDPDGSLEVDPKPGQQMFIQIAEAHAP